MIASNVHELLEWMEPALARGLGRFELWSKPRGADQRTALTFELGADPWSIADEAWS